MNARHAVLASLHMSVTAVHPVHMQCGVTISNARSYKAESK